MADPNVWKLKHRVVYEKAFGKIPAGHAIIFLDQNKLNVSLDNLEMVSRRELQQLNKRKLMSENKEQTTAAINLIRLKELIREKKRGK